MMYLLSNKNTVRDYGMGIEYNLHLIDIQNCPFRLLERFDIAEVISLSLSKDDIKWSVMLSIKTNNYLISDELFVGKTWIL